MLPRHDDPPILKTAYRPISDLGNCLSFDHRRIDVARPLQVDSAIAEVGDAEAHILIDLAIDARKNLDALIALIDQSRPVLDSQTASSDSVQAWAAHLQPYVAVPGGDECLGLRQRVLHSGARGVRVNLDRGPASTSTAWSGFGAVWNAAARGSRILTR